MTTATVQPPNTETHPQTTWDGQQILDALLTELPESTTALQQQALDALKQKQYSQCKVFPCLALDDPFIKAIGYMSSIPSIVEKKVPTLPTLVAESCRAIAEARGNLSFATANQEANKAFSQAEQVRKETLSKLERLNQQIFEKVLG